MLDAKTRLLLNSAIKSLNALQATIHEYIETITEHNKPDSYAHEPVIKQAINPEISLPPAVTAYYEAEQRERPSKNKWERVKRLIEIVAFFSAIGAAFFTYKTLRQVKRQADSAQDQVGIMQRQLEATDRPWVTAQVRISSALTSDENGLRLTFLFTGQNVGKSPAQFVGVDPELIPSIGPPIQRQREICNIQASRFAHAVNFGGTLLFPSPLSPEFSESSELLLTWRDLDAYWKQFTSKDGKTAEGSNLLPLDVTGCLGYASSSKTHHQTGFSYRISLSNGRTPFRKDLPIPATQLLLTPDIAGFWGD